MLGTYPKILFTGTQAEYNALADAKAKTLPLPTDAISLFSGSNTFPSPVNCNIVSPSVIIKDASRFLAIPAVKS